MEFHKKTIGISVPCFREEDNVVPLCNAIMDIFRDELPEYDCIIQFIDNNSPDRTQERLIKLCEEYPNVRAIFNSQNFRGRSALYGLLQAEGDCVIYLSADFQDPIERIPEFVRKWEEGYLIVAGVKAKTHENAFLSLMRSCFYKIMYSMTDVQFINQFCNFGVYDQKFLDIIRKLKHPNYSIRGNVAEYGYNICLVEYEQQQRRAGKSSYNLISLLNLAINNFIIYSNIIPRIATVLGGLSATFFLLAIVIFLVVGLVLKTSFILPIIILCVFLAASINSFLIGIVGEYVLYIKNSQSGTPLVVERRRINFTEKELMDDRDTANWQ